MWQRLVRPLVGRLLVSPLPAQQAGRIRGFDHVALPMENTAAMLAFYRALGCDVIEKPTVLFGPFRRQHDQLSPSCALARQDVHEPSPCRGAALRGPLLRVGRYGQVRESFAGPRWGKGRARSGSEGGGPPEDQVRASTCVTPTETSSNS